MKTKQKKIKSGSRPITRVCPFCKAVVKIRSCNKHAREHGYRKWSVMIHVYNAQMDKKRKDADITVMIQ